MTTGSEKKVQRTNIRSPGTQYIRSTVAEPRLLAKREGLYIYAVSTLCRNSCNPIRFQNFDMTSLISTYHLWPYSVFWMVPSHELALSTTFSGLYSSMAVELTRAGEKLTVHAHGKSHADYYVTKHSTAGNNSMISSCPGLLPSRARRRDFARLYGTVPSPARAKFYVRSACA